MVIHASGGGPTSIPRTGLKSGDKVRVCDPDSEFYNWQGEVVEKVGTVDTQNRPHRYYRVRVSSAGSAFYLTFREHRIERVGE